MKERPPDRPEKSRELMESILDSFFDQINKEKGSCPDGGALGLWKQGELTGPEADTVRSHVEICGECQLSLEGEGEPTDEKMSEEARHRLEAAIDRILKR